MPAVLPAQLCACGSPNNLINCLGKGQIPFARFNGASPAAASAEDDMSETVLDLRGLRCPYPVIRAKAALGEVAIDGVLVLECTDPLTMIDIPHFANQTGHRLVGTERRGELFVFRIIKQR